MSGLAVIFNRDGSPVESEVLGSLIGELSARGPDGCRQEVRGSVGCAHQHFWTTPEELGERQPLQASSDQFLVVFDGRLDNRDQLLAQLSEGLPLELGIPSDAALVVAAYERWGSDSCQRLIGSFAVVIADLERRRVLCARDPLGDRTLFYHLTDRELVVASEEGALLAHPAIGSDLDETRLACFLALRLPADGSTFFRQVREVLPGELLTVGERTVSRNQFWSPRAGPSLRRRSEDDLTEEYRDLLRQAVSCRLRASTPPAVMMSGGLDSTSVAALGAEILRNSRPDWRLSAVSWVFDEFLDCDERLFMSPVTDRWQLEVLQVNGDDAIPLSHEGVLCRHPGTPEENVYRELKRRVFSLAAAAGSRVVLNCASADALYSGAEGWLLDLVRAGHPVRAGMELLAEMRRWGPWNALRRTTALRWPAKLRRLVVPPDTPEIPWLRRDAYRLVNEATSLRFEDTRGLRASQIEAATGLRAARSFSLENSYAAREGIELRDPYRDLRLVEFMLRVPAYQLYRHGRYKPIVRRALDGWLPNSILQRTKPTLLTPLFEEGLRGRNRQVVEDLLGSKDALWPRYVERRWIVDSLGKSISPAVDVVLWQCVCLEMWRRRRGWSSTAVSTELP